MKFAALLMGAMAATASATVLTPDNYDDATSGKTVFIKFLAPWCGHCKKMAPDWNKLMDEYDGHATKLIGDVDCTAEGKPLCEANGVRGYPTLKYGDPSDLQDYQGGRDLASLKKHAEEKLVPMCSPANIDLCDDDQKAQIEQFSAMSADDLQTLVDAEVAKMAKAESDFKAGVEGLQKQYEQMTKDKDAKIEEIKAAGLGVMKAVLKSKK